MNSINHANSSRWKIWVICGKTAGMPTATVCLRDVAGRKTMVAALGSGPIDYGIQGN